MEKCAFAAIAVLAVGSLKAASDPPAIGVKSTPAAITLDGRLTEPAWQGAPLFRLTQQSPRPGEPAPYITEVRVLLAGDLLYFGVVCRDPEPDRIAVHTMRRDDPMEGDDTVAIVLDTYGDRKTGYLFRVNAAGARADGLIAGLQDPSYDWDGIWDTRAVRIEDGWSLEIAIPSRTLSFTPGLDQWGLNVERSIPRDRTVMRWASPTLDSFLHDLSRAGALSGLGELRQGRGLEFTPYTIGRMKERFGRSQRAWQGAAGGEFTWKISPQLVTVFTANTDFAETEADARQINLTRFSLFFPEKRAFFLEGANQYEFGLGLGEQFIPFFSRRIGFLEGEPIPIESGAKLNGRVGRWNLAMLDVQTRKTVTSAGIVPATNLLAGRVSYDLTNQLRVGTIFTNGDPQALRRNSLIGVDAVWRTSTFRGNKNLLVGGWSAMSSGDRRPGRRNGWGARVDYPNDFLECSASFNDYGVALNPALGFLPRTGVRRTEAECTIKPRPAKTGLFRSVRQQFFENDFTLVQNHLGFTESWGFRMAPVNFRLESGDRVEFNWFPSYEFLAVPFKIAPGVTIPPGSYQFTRWRLEAQTSTHRPLQAGFTTWFGGFYNGNLAQWQHYVRWTSPRGRLQLGLSAENDFGHLPQGNFVQRLWQLQSTFAWNPNLVLSSFVQYDTESQNLGANTRLRWTLKPGNDLFVVWNRGWQKLILSPRDLSLIPDNELLAVKLRWTFRT